jgi:hypothetical protein
MATTKTLLDFAKNSLNAQESNAVKGGKAYVPTDSGSTGYINWDDVVIRENEILSTSSGILTALPGSKRK